jgi:glycosyltransferase involved in cell wall biosynthesis
VIQPAPPGKKRVLIIHPRLVITGGASVAAWVIEALREQWDVSVLVREGGDYEALNRFFGTSLQERDFRVFRVDSLWSRLLHLLPVQGEMLRIALIIRESRRLDRRHRFDILISTNNEFDFGRKGIQYIHYPSLVWPRPTNELRWYHRKWTVALYKTAFSLLSGTSISRMRQNVTLCNSGYIAELTRQAHGSRADILYPPVPGVFPEIPWSERSNAIVAIGRIAPEKRWALAVETVRLVRETGVDLKLTLIGTADHREVEVETHELVARYEDWFTLHLNLSRPELVHVVARHRYGIHTMENEHFGIAPAEIQRAGCIVFVHRSGGPMEIVGHDERQMFASPEEGAARIAAVIGDPDLQLELRAAGAERSKQFTSEAFMQAIRKLAEGFQA